MASQSLQTLGLPCLFPSDHQYITNEQQSYVLAGKEAKNASLEHNHERFAIFTLKGNRSKGLKRKIKTAPSICSMDDQHRLTLLPPSKGQVDGAKRDALPCYVSSLLRELTSHFQSNCFKHLKIATHLYSYAIGLKKPQRADSCLADCFQEQHSRSEDKNQEGVVCVFSFPPLFPSQKKKPCCSCL